MELEKRLNPVMKEPDPGKDTGEQKSNPETYLGKQIERIEFNISYDLKCVKDILNRLEI